MALWKEENKWTGSKLDEGKKITSHEKIKNSVGLDNFEERDVKRDKCL